MQRKTTLLAVAMLLALAAPALAQSPKALLKRGNALFAKAEYEDAFAVFEKAYAKKPDAVFLRSMAFCQLKLYQHEKARGLLQQYLKKFPKAPDIEKMKDLEKSLEVVVQTKVSISSTPPKAEIFIDAEVAGKVGETPKTLTIEPGKHVVILKLPGYHTTTQTFEIQPRETKSLSLTMEVPFNVTSAPEGASVHIDSATSPSLGNTPLESGITPGQHKVFVKKEGYKTHEETVNAAPNQPVKVTATLQLGISVASTPSGATVLLDGKEVGTTPTEVAATPGSYSVEVKLGPCTPFTQKVEVVPGQPAKVDAKLGCGMLSMRTDVQGVVVSSDGMKIGETPLETGAIPPGTHKLALTHPDRRDWSMALDLDGRTDISARVKLGHKAWPAWLMGGVAVAGLALAIAGNVMAYQRKDETVTVSTPDGDVEKNKFTDENGECGEWDSKLGDYRSIGCGSAYKFHHMTTAGYVLAGTGAVSSFLYYWFFVRPKVEIKRSPRGEATAAQR